MKKMLTGFFAIVVMNVSAQGTNPTVPEATRSIDGIVKEVLRIVSGEKGKTRDWDAFRNLFLPTAHFTVNTHDPSKQEPIQTVSLEEFIQMVDDGSRESAFVESELGKTVDEYNGIAQVFQAYYSKDGDREEKGINSYQLVYYNNRWWIANIVWTGDSNGRSVPDKYLQK
ncbi:MAG: hypothetical protein WA874_12030 [Chryseosolibacter sp.]